MTFSDVYEFNTANNLLETHITQTLNQLNFLNYQNVYKSVDPQKCFQSIKIIVYVLKYLKSQRI